MLICVEVTKEKGSVKENGQITPKVFPSKRLTLLSKRFKQEVPTLAPNYVRNTQSL